MLKVQYAHQLATGQTYKRTLSYNGSKWILHPTKGAWKLVAVTEDHPWSNTLEAYMRSLAAQAVSKFSEELGSVLMAETAAFNVSNQRASITSEIQSEASPLLQQTYLTTHGAQVSSQPVETTVSGDLNEVEVDADAAQKNPKGILDESGLTTSQQKKSKLVLGLLGFGAVAYGIYHFFLKPKKA